MPSHHVLGVNTVSAPTGCLELMTPTCMLDDDAGGGGEVNNHESLNID